MTFMDIAVVLNEHCTADIIVKDEKGRSRSGNIGLLILLNNHPVLEMNVGTLEGRPALFFLTDDLAN